MRTSNRFIIGLLGVGVLTACGGGDDGGPAARDPVAVNASNGQRVAIDVIQGGQAITGLGSTIVFSAATAEHGSLPGLRALAYDIALDTLAGGVSSGGVTTAEAVTENCPGGGTRTVNVNDKNGNGRADAGDSTSTTFENCAEDGAVANGTVGLDVIALQGNPPSTGADWTLTVGLQFSNFSVSASGERLTIGGGFNLAARYRQANQVFRFATSGSELSFSNETDTAHVVNFSFVETIAGASGAYSVQQNFTYDPSDLAGSVKAVTNTPFSGVAGFPPESGRLTIRGANNTRVVVQATGGGTARISIDANGDGDYTDSEDRVINGQWATFFG